MVGIGMAILVMAFSIILINSAYGQTSEGKQVTISGDIQNNTAAQEILKKIEQSKRWIEKIEQRNFESSERQKELEKKRAEVLQSLQEDLKKWEELWEYHTFDKMLERALESSPAKDTSTVYDHHLKFTASKINAGRDALDKVLLAGGGPEKARDAFVSAAKITRTEMATVNSIYNVLHKHAYYNQQILFGSEGNFDMILSGEKLRKYYQDYRTNPAYLQANPFDEISWKDLGKNTADTECRTGYVLVYRTHADDYVCTTEYTAEMWVRHNMGTPVKHELFDTMNTIDIQKFQKDRVYEKIDNLNSKLSSMQKHHEKKMSDTEKKYEYIFANMDEKKNNEEKEIIDKFNKTDSMSKETFSHQISDIREKYRQLKEITEDEKSRLLKILEGQHQTNINNFVQNYESDSEIKIKWNSSSPVFEAEMNLS